MDIDNEPEIIAKYSPRNISNDVRTKLVAWTDKPDVEIVQLDHRNAPVFHIMQRSYSSKSKTVDMNLKKQRRENNKQTNVYEYNDQHVVDLNDVT